MTAIYNYHQSVEPQPLGLTNYVTQIMSVDYYNDVSHICSQMCDKYGSNGRTETHHHVCAYVNVKDGRVFMGENSTRQLPGCPISTHAEMDGMRKILKNTPTINGQVKRIEKYDVIVIRISKTNKLGSSRPCKHCIMSLVNAKAVKIRYVYYSTRQGTIVREKIEDMLDCTLTCISTGWRSRTRRTRDGSPIPEDSGSDSDSSSSSNSSNSSSPKLVRRSTSPINISNITIMNNGERTVITNKKFEKLLRKNSK
jgi:hypothetical protein